VKRGDGVNHPLHDRSLDQPLSDSVTWYREGVCHGHFERQGGAGPKTVPLRTAGLSPLPTLKQRSHYKVWRLRELNEDEVDSCKAQEPEAHQMGAAIV